MKNFRGFLYLSLLMVFVFACSNVTILASANNFVTEYYDLENQELMVISPFLDTTTLIGKMSRNSFGYPLSSFSVTPLLGVDVKKFNNLPSREVVEREAKRYAERYPDATYEELNAILARKLHPGTFTYINYGTEVLIIPKIGTGFMLPFSREPDNIGYFHLGVQFPLVIQSGFQFVF